MKTALLFRTLPDIVMSVGLLSLFNLLTASCNIKPDVNASTPVTANIPANDGRSGTEGNSTAGNGSDTGLSAAVGKPFVKIDNVADAATIIARKQVPILCYHHIKEWTPKTSARAKDYIVPVAAFKEQLKMLADSGYQTILPDQLYSYLAAGTPLPAKPVMLTFDDTDLEQFTVALPEMKKYGFKGVFFIMTVSLNRPNYMTREQVKALSDDGHEIGSHTWDHRNVKLYGETDWVTQIEKPTKQLSAITGKPVRYFAYPFGLWNPQAIPELKKRGFEAAFQLATARDPQDPLFTIRRIIVPGYWGSKALNKSMMNSFR